MVRQTRHFRGPLLTSQNASPWKVHYSMTYKSNPYTDQIKSQGRDPVNSPAKLGEFPKTIYGRTYDTQEEYLAAIHDFLNGNWWLLQTSQKSSPNWELKETSQVTSDALNHVRVHNSQTSVIVRKTLFTSQQDAIISTEWSPHFIRLQTRNLKTFVIVSYFDFTQFNLLRMPHL